MPPSLSTSAARPKVKHSSESILFAVDFTKLLPAGEMLTGTPTVMTSPESGLTLGSPIVNTNPFDNDDGATVAIGAGVQFRAAGGVSPTDYVLTVGCATNQANTRVVVCTLQVRDT
jgi:hypothetical protein